MSPAIDYAGMCERAQGHNRRATPQRKKEVTAFEKRLAQGGWAAHQGSHNTGPTAAAAAGRYDLLAEMCRQWADPRVGGLFGRELGSPGIYTTSVWEALMMARDADPAVRRALRAIAAFYCLTALPWARREVVGYLFGEPVLRRSQRPGYTGISSVVSGNRWQFKEPRGWDTSDPAGEMLSMALNWPGRRKDPGVGGHRKNMAPNRPGAGQVCAILGDFHFFEDSTPADIFGLTNEEREVLRRVVEADPRSTLLEGLPIDAQIAAGWVREFGVFRNADHPAGPVSWRWLLVRKTGGAESVFGPKVKSKPMSALPSPEKPPHAVTTMTTGGVWSTGRPSFGRTQKPLVTGWSVEVLPKMIRAKVTPEAGGEVHVPRVPGAVLWSYLIEGATVRPFTEAEL